MSFTPRGLTALRNAVSNASESELDALLEWMLRDGDPPDIEAPAPPPLVRQFGRGITVMTTEGRAPFTDVTHEYVNK